MGWKTPVVWVVFLAWIVAGGVLMSSQDGTLRGIGITLYVTLALALMGLALAHYVSQRRQARLKQ